MILYILGPVVLGLVCGMLVNYLADVLPWKRCLTLPICTSCLANMPIKNYLLWPRVCPVCSKRRPWRTWIVEIVYAFITVGLWQSPPDKIGFVLGLIVLVYFGVVVVIDLEHRLIMHPVSIAGAVLAFGIGVYSNGIVNTLVGGIFGFGIMWVFYMLGERIMKMIARRRGLSTDDVALGFGDVNLSGVLGLLLGWPEILVGLVLGVFLGGAISLLYIVLMVVLRRYQAFTAVPYGPFLISGAIWLIYFREAVLRLLGG